MRNRSRIQAIIAFVALVLSFAWFLVPATPAIAANVFVDSRLQPDVIQPVAVGEEFYFDNEITNTGSDEINNIFVFSNVGTFQSGVSGPLASGATRVYVFRYTPVEADAVRGYVDVSFTIRYR